MNDIIQSDCSCSGEIVQGVIEEEQIPSIYPNPTSDFLNVFAQGRVLILDSNGQLLFDQVVNGRTSIDVQKWAAGIYVLKMTTGDYSWIKLGSSKK